MKKVIHHIKRVRQQPEEVRRHILHVTTIIFAAILFILWVYSLGAKFSNGDADVDLVENEPGPLSTMKENFVGGYRSITE